MDFFPEKIVPFWEFFRNCFHASGFRYFVGFMWVCVGMRDRKCLTRLAANCPLLERHVSSWSRFFSESPWDLKSLRVRVYHFS